MGERRKNAASSGGRRRADDPLTSPVVFDKEIEEQLVGWLLANPERANEVCGAAVSDGHFHGYRARSLYRAIDVVVRDGNVPHVDAVSQALATLGVSDVGKVDAIQLMAGFPRGGTWEDYARRVRDGARRRALAYAVLDVTDRLTFDDFETVRADLYAALDAAEDSVRPVEADRFGSVMEAVWQEYEGGVKTVATGFAALDGKIHGVRRGAYVVLGARTSVGKTALAVTLAVNWARMGLKVSYISAEMDQISLGQRYAGVIAELPVVDLAAAKLTMIDRDRLVQVCEMDLPIATDDTALSLAQVRARVMQHRRLLGGLDVIFVDYVQLLDAEGGSDEERRYQALGRISRGLKRLGKETGACMFALAQLNRTTHQRKEPEVSDLRESGDLEQDADQVWLLWRDEKQKRMVLKVAKNRQGPTGRVSLRFVGHATRFVEHEDEADPDEG